MLLNHPCMFSIALLIKNVCHSEKPSLEEKTVNRDLFLFDVTILRKIYFTLAQ